MGIVASLTLGTIALEYSAFAVEGRPDLAMLIYNPATDLDARHVGALMKTLPAASR